MAKPPRPPKDPLLEKAEEILRRLRENPGSVKLHRWADVRKRLLPRETLDRIDQEVAEEVRKRLN